MDKKVLALIPARGNSKRLPGKNLKKMNGVSLLERTVIQALGCNYIDLVVVSSEDDTVLEYAVKYGANTVKRPPNLSADTAPTIDAVLHACNEYSEYEVVILLQPTSPLREISDLDRAFHKMAEKNAEQVISICELDHPVQWNMQLLDNGKIAFIHSEGERSKRSQDYDVVYRLNGAIYISNIDFLKKSKTFVSDKAIGSIMARERSIDVDTQYDFSLAESMENIID